VPPFIINLTYLIAAVLFIVGLQGLAHPRTAVRGNLLGALGMFLAIVVTLFDHHIIGYGVIIAGIIVGSAIGTVLAVRVEMTAMPQMVALLNGFGGGASVLVAWAAMASELYRGNMPGFQMTTATMASGIIGAVTFWGSLVAFAKLQGLINEGATTFPGQQLANAGLGVVLLLLSIWGITDPQADTAYVLLVIGASVLGLFLTLPIGGADMPVVIALLNSYSGLAGAATGFVLDNNVLIIAGSLVGASGIILTQIMCRAMNRSLTNVLFGVAASSDAVASQDEVYAGKIKATSADEVAMLFDGAQRVVVVPGYGMAVSQAQYAVRDLMNLLNAKGITVEFAIHPVAGRMPGHMNVLLAEANVPYDTLKEMDEINPTFEQTNVAIVIGANDVVNPMARDVPNCPIAGMPILEVDKAHTVVVIKRSLSPGFAGIPNPLFALDNTLMLFADGKKAILDIIAAVKEG
jgi:NAD(P) transhydrogenase subunit beta